jgi:hypothetical protein
LPLAIDDDFNFAIAAADFAYVVITPVVNFTYAVANDFASSRATYLSRR